MTNPPNPGFTTPPPGEPSLPTPAGGPTPSAPVGPDFSAPPGSFDDNLAPRQVDNSAWMSDSRFTDNPPESRSWRQRIKDSIDIKRANIRQEGIRLSVIVGIIAVVVAVFATWLLFYGVQSYKEEREQSRARKEAVTMPTAPAEGEKAGKPEEVFPLGYETGFEFSGTYNKDGHLLAVLAVNEHPKTTREVAGRLVAVKVRVAPDPEQQKVARLKMLGVLRVVDNRGLTHTPVQVRMTEVSEPEGRLEWWSEEEITQHTGWAYFLLSKDASISQVQYCNVAWDPAMK